MSRSSGGWNRWGSHVEVCGSLNGELCSQISQSYAEVGTPVGQHICGLGCMMLMRNARFIARAAIVMTGCVRGVHLIKTLANNGNPRVPDQIGVLAAQGTCLAGCALLRRSILQDWCRGLAASCNSRVKPNVGRHLRDEIPFEICVLASL